MAGKTGRNCTYIGLRTTRRLSCGVGNCTFRPLDLTYLTFPAQLKPKNQGAKPLGDELTKGRTSINRS